MRLFGRSCRDGGVRSGGTSRWGSWDPSPSYHGDSQQNSVFSNRRDGRATFRPILYAAILDLPEVLASDGLATYSSCGSGFHLGNSSLVHPHCEFCLLSPVGLRPQEFSLLVKEPV